MTPTAQDLYGACSLLTYLIVAVDLTSPLEEFHERKPLNTSRKTPVLDELIDGSRICARGRLSGVINPFSTWDGEIFLCQGASTGCLPRT